jgi:cell surface protein SprA
MLYNSLTEIEVWINTTNAVELGRILARAYINLPTRTSRFDSYPILYDTLTESHPGKFEEGYFKRLEINKDYRVSEYTGTISMNFSVADNQTIAAAYRTYDGKYYGEFIGIDTNQMPLILKLIKPRSIHPSYSPAWDMMLKNIYKLDTSLLSLPNNNFDLEIVYKSQNGLEDTTIIGEHLLRIVGLDKYSDNGGENPDHRFDFLPRFTIDRENGEIIFPTLRPFDSGIRDFFQQKNPPVNVPDSLLFPSFYDMRLTYEQQHPKSGYFIKWKFYNQ